MLVSASSTVTGALAFLLAFSVLTIVAMGVASTVWGRSLATPFATSLNVAAGAVGVLVGLGLVAESVAGAPLF